MHSNATSSKITAISSMEVLPRDHHSHDQYERAQYPEHQCEPSRPKCGLQREGHANAERSAKENQAQHGNHLQYPPRYEEATGTGTLIFTHLPEEYAWPAARVHCANRWAPHCR